MHIHHFQLFNEGELFDRLRNVEIANDRTSRPYAYSNMALETRGADRIAICQKYVLKDTIEAIKKIDAKFRETHGHSIFEHRGFVRVFFGDEVADPKTGEKSIVERKSGYRDFLPPIVEDSPDDNQSHLLCDGLHRLYVARELDIRPVIVHITGVDPRFPYYATPNATGWKEVAAVDAKPASKDEKKNYRIDAYKTLFRDFNTAFEAVTVARESAKA